MWVTFIGGVSNVAGCVLEGFNFGAASAMIAAAKPTVKCV